ncbi:MAG: hypothetical protein EXR71_18515 [Myxococcales bacterium]|nr:hypothetical protein [Myxococcales bacterium]
MIQPMKHTPMDQQSIGVRSVVGVAAGALMAGQLAIGGIVWWAPAVRHHELSARTFVPALNAGDVTAATVALAGPMSAEYATHDIARAVAEAAASSGDIAAAARASVLGARSVAGSAEHLDQAGAQLSELAASLRELTAAWRTDVAPPDSGQTPSGAPVAIPIFVMG